MKRRCAVLLMACVLAFSFFARAEEETPKLRALLIGCDYFLSQADTAPAAENNIDLLARALLADGRGYALVRTLPNALSDQEQLMHAVGETFGKAKAGDVSLLYISTHGVYEEEAPCKEAALLLSDGIREGRLTAQSLKDILDTVPGTKVLILDACHSGAFIGKGMSAPSEAALFSGPDYKVLCSAGGSEASWYWQGTDAVSGGASYFATVLADALGVHGVYSADRNMDGAITLAEVYDYICEHYAASTPQVYPQREAEFPLLCYDTVVIGAPEAAVTDIVFDDTLLPAGQREVSFAFTVRRPCKLYYQLVYHENGAWQFDTAQHYLDGEQPDGLTLPGRKARTLCLDTGRKDSYGYAMLQFITVEDGIPALQGARLLCVSPDSGDISLSVVTDAAFCPEMGQEAAIRVLHDKPCGLTVRIQDEEGKTVCYLAYEMPSRPQQLTPAASTFYWDGKDSRGRSCPPGRYAVQVQVRIGETVHAAESTPFRLLCSDSVGRQQ